MEIIDGFCGIGPWSKRDPLLPYRPEDILELMDYFGIARALVYANVAADLGKLPEANRIVADTARAEPRFLPAFSLGVHAYEGSPAPGDYLAEMRACGARAAWLWPQAGGFWPWLVGGLLAMCSETRVPLFVHAENVGPDDVHRLCEEFPDLRLVLAGVPYGADVWLYPLVRRHENLRVCLGHFYIPSGGPRRFLEHFPAERLLFGSGLPKFSPGGLIGHVMYADLDDEAREKIMGGNLARLLSEARL